MHSVLRSAVSTAPRLATLAARNNLTPALATGTIHSLQTVSSLRSFAADANAKTKKKGKKGGQTEEDTLPETRKAQKQAAKERRRSLYESRQERKERVKDRRKLSSRDGSKRHAFRKWFIPRHKVHHEYLERKARQAGLDWKLRVLIVLERLNVVLPDMEQWERDYVELASHLEQYDRDYPSGLKVDRGNPDGEMPTDDDLYKLLEERGFTPAPRVTAADESGDVRTTNRKLKTSVFLTVQESNDGIWNLPTVDLQTDETFVEAARRAIPDMLGSDLEFWCPSNCPCAVDMIPFDSPEDGYYGVKTFVMKIQYDDGAVDEQAKKVADYAWLDRDEIASRMEEQHDINTSLFYKYLL